MRNCHIRVDIIYHDFLHGFRAGRDAGISSIEAKLLQHLKSMKEEVLYEVFLDLSKEYDNLYWEQFMKIIIAYGVVP